MHIYTRSIFLLNKYLLILVKCAQKSDCSSLNCPEHHDAHCVDSHCHCGMPANGGPGGPGGPGSHDGQH